VPTKGQKENNQQTDLLLRGVAARRIAEFIRRPAAYKATAQSIMGAVAMWRHALEDVEQSWNAPELSDVSVRDGQEDIEKWPTPAELYFQTGIVLALALGADVVVQLVLGGA
jgi:hypothetical protein